MPPEQSPAARTSRNVHVLVVGAGFSGVGAAIRLRQHGFRDVVVLEREAQIGGTWRQNTYPGCACDVPSSLYSYSFAPNPGWTRMFARQREIHDYLRMTAERHGLGPSLRCGVRVLGARWDELARRWRVETTDGPYSASSLVLATGPWDRPRRLEVPGLAEFPGPVFHTARWDHSVDLTGRRVVVVGGGASAVQVIPEIAPKVAALHLFQRTAQWLMPRPDLPTPPAIAWCLRHVPGAQRALRAAQRGMLEGVGLALRHPHLIQPLERAARLHLRLAVRDRELRRALTPDYRLGCKRLLTSSAFYPTLLQPHVHLHPTAATAVRADVVIGADGTRARADAIVLATGFHIGELPLGRSVHGAGGATLHDVWDGVPEAHLGTNVSGFPNLFLLLGPNLQGGSTSSLTALEAQLAYLTAALTHLRDGGFASLDVRPNVQAHHNAAVQQGLSTTVYNTGGCASYYLSANGRNTFCWPWSTRRLVRRLRRFDPADYLWRDHDPSVPWTRDRIDMA